MSREIKFRGIIKYDSFNKKEKDKWVYGFFKKESSEYFTDSAYFIIDRGVAYRVIPESVGQLINLKDKNGKEIYEGDIVKCVTEKEGAEEYVGMLYKVEFDPYKGYDAINIFKSDEYEVIGNVYENPELLEKEK